MEYKIGVIGLGYVGLPLAVAFAKKYSVVGYDINKQRIKEIKKNLDVTGEINSNEIKNINLKSFSETNKQIGLWSTYEVNHLNNCNTFIVTVPTPINKFKGPNLKLLLDATETLSKIIKKNDLVIYESTVYPGATEEECLPILERNSNLRLNFDFYIGYSPERINPGDKKNTLTNIQKVVSGSNSYATKKINKLYSSIIKAGTHVASSIKVAEAAKVIENCQRDVNIAFVNELVKIFRLLNIDTYDVLEAAATKWNFLNFTPGLVGGHCIGVDPYYLIQKANEKGHNPELILSARKINESMGSYVANEFIKVMFNSHNLNKKSKILILGITFKENCPDIRNTEVLSIYNKLIEFGLEVDIYDPIADASETKNIYNIQLISKIKKDSYDGIILAVSHNEFRKLNFENMKKQKNAIIFDVKGFLENYTHRL